MILLALPLANWGVSETWYQMIIPQTHTKLDDLWSQLLLFNMYTPPFQKKKMLPCRYAKRTLRMLWGKSGQCQKNKEIGHNVGLNSPAGCKGITQVLGLLEKRVLMQQELSATPRPLSIQTPRDSITPWWTEMKKQSRVYGNEGRRNVWTVESAKTGNLPWWRGPPYFPSLRTQHVLRHPLQALLHTTAKPDQQPDHAPSHRGYCHRKPFGGLYQLASSDEAEVDFFGEKWMGEAFELRLSVIYDFQQICWSLELLSHLGRSKGGNCCCRFSSMPADESLFELSAQRKGGQWTYFKDRYL